MAEPAFLIVGTPRSGTTLVQRLARELPGVAVPLRAFRRACEPGSQAERLRYRAHRGRQPLLNRLTAGRRGFA